MRIAVRYEQPRDWNDVREVNEQAFDTPFEARLVDALRDTPDSISLVATVDDRVIGHILFTPISMTPPTGVRVAGLAPMSVRAEHQRMGAGSRLVREGLEECRKRGFAAVVLVGHPEYYPRFGFVPAHTRGLTCEFGVPQEAFMVLDLRDGALDGVHGVVRYRPEFSQA